jgi:peptidase S41-like protein/AMP-activated protein kinase-like protein
MDRRFACFLATWATLTVPSSAYPQQKPTLDAAARSRAIDGIVRCLREGYVFPEVGQKMEKAIRDRAAAGAYDRITDGEALAAELTNDLRAVSHDRHLHVDYSAAALPPEPETWVTAPPPMSEAERRSLARENFGLSKLDILKGNVGFLQFRLLAPPEVAGDTYVAAMNYLANTDALIIDLRTCGGAISPDAIPMLCSYFFASPTHINDIYWRPDDSTRQFWTWAHVPGKRYLDKPIYLLTSHATFSGAEELAYDLKNLKRATLIGETTGGGAHGGGDRRVDDHFTVWVPFGRAINPITKTDWEGVGVNPDVAVTAVRALHQAHVTALQQLIATTDDSAWKERLKGTLAEVERDAPRLKRVAFSLKGHPDAREVSVAGTFNSWSPGANPLVRQGDGWVGDVEAAPGRLTYKFVVDGRWILDPANPQTEADGEFTNSVRRVE